MYKLLIVDDDSLVRKFLREFYPWEQEGFALVGEAEGGAQALALVRAHAPDLVLTDVEMPDMDGAALAARLREDGFSGGVLAISRHEDFAHVKETMRAGADDYLRKSCLEGATLREALAHVTAAMEKRRADEAERAALRRMAEKSSRLMRRELLERLFERETGWEEQYRETKAAGLKNRYYRCAALVLAAESAAPPRGPGLYEICARLTTAGLGELADLGRGRIAVLYDFSELPSSQQQYALLREQGAALLGAVRAVSAEPCRVGVSAVCEGGGTLARALRQAGEALDHTFYGDPICFFDEQRRLSAHVPDEAAAFAENLPGLLRQGGAQALEDAFSKALRAFRQADAQPLVLVSWLRQCDSEAGVQRDEQEYESLHSLAACQSCLGAYFDRLRILSAPVGAPVSPSIARAMQYVRAHHAEPIGLGHAARDVGLSPAYLSRAFKHEAGIGFAEFLTRCRLEHVQKELAESLQTIKKLAAEAGFQDYPHFCKTFKKKFGVSPAQYRKELRNGKRAQ